MLSAVDVLAGAEVGEEILVFDRLGDMEASLVAERLIERGLSVTYVTPLDSFAPRAGYLQHLDLLPAFQRGGCDILTGLDIERVDGDRVHLVDRRGVRVERPADTIVAALAPEPENGLVATVAEMSIPCHLIGDALALRHARAAINDGDTIGRAI